MLDNVLRISVCAIMNPVGLEQGIYDDYARYRLQLNDGLLPLACNSLNTSHDSVHIFSICDDDP